MTKHSDTKGAIDAVSDSLDSVTDAKLFVGGALEAFLGGTSSSQTLSLAKANWIFGDWEALCSIDLAEGEGTQEAGTLAALKAVGFQQLNDVASCKKYVKSARELGCSDSVINMLLLAGIHNTMARISALKKDGEKSQNHFHASLEGAVNPNSPNYKLAMQARSVRELTNLGLLDDAAGIVHSELQSLLDSRHRPSLQKAKVSMLTTEMQLINHQLMLAYKKSVLFRKTDCEQNIFNTEGSVNTQALNKLSTSQLGQDLWVLEKTNYKKGGFFVEFGATDGVLLSNTYLLETQFDWNGICAEPNPDYYKKLEKNRKCIVSDTCIGAKTGELVEFVLANEYGGIADMALQGKHAEKVSPYQETGATVFMETMSLHDFLTANKAPKTIDYLSIDTEGSEFTILKQFPFREWDVRFLTVEHNYEPQRESIFELMDGLGYKRVSNQWDDYYFKQ